MQEIKIWNDPFDMGFSVPITKTVNLMEGLTIVAGCNESGKTTFIRNLRMELSRLEYSFHCYFGNIRDIINSKGDINKTLDLFKDEISYFILNGRTKKQPLTSIRINKFKKNKIFVIIDGFDNGLSYDTLCKFNSILDELCTIAKENKKEFYLIVTSIQYETIKNRNVLNVITGKYLSITSYDQYVSFMTSNRKLVDGRHLNKKGNITALS